MGTASCYMDMVFVVTVLCSVRLDRYVPGRGGGIADVITPRETSKRRSTTRRYIGPSVMSCMNTYKLLSTPIRSLADTYTQSEGRRK
jgi:hypothetical protein